MNDSEKQQLRRDIKGKIMERLDIAHMKPEEVPNDAQLFGKNNPLGLDSIDAIEIIMTIQEEYGVRISDQDHARVILNSIDSIAEFLEKEQVKI